MWNAEYMVQMRKDSTECGRVGRYGFVTRGRAFNKKIQDVLLLCQARGNCLYIASDFNLDLMKQGRVSGGFKPGIHESRKHNQPPCIHATTRNDKFSVTGTIWPRYPGGSQ